MCGKAAPGRPQRRTGRFRFAVGASAVRHHRQPTLDRARALNLYASRWHASPLALIAIPEPTLSRPGSGATGPGFAFPLARSLVAADAVRRRRCLAAARRHGVRPLRVSLVRVPPSGLRRRRVGIGPCARPALVP